MTLNPSDPRLLERIAMLSLQMHPISAQIPSFRGMLYSESGGGKTTLSAEIMQQIVPEGKGILFVDTSEGWVSLRNLPHLMRRTQYVPFSSIDDLKAIAYAIRNKIGVYQYIGGVILDEGSSMAQIDTDRLHQLRLQTGKTDSLVPEWPDYNGALARFRDMLQMLFDCPGLHIIVNAHVADKKNNRGEIVRIFPSFSPKIAAKVKEPLHLVSYMSMVASSTGADEPIYERTAQVHPTNRVDAKTRLPISTTRIPAESLPVLIHTWLQSGGQEVAHDSTPREDPVEDNRLADKTPEEALEVVDIATDAGLDTEIDLDFSDDDFSPIGD